MTTIITTTMIVIMMRATIIPAAIAAILDRPDEVPSKVDIINEKTINEKTHLLELKLNQFLYYILL